MQHRNLWNQNTAINVKKWNEFFWNDSPTNKAYANKFPSYFILGYLSKNFGLCHESIEDNPRTIKYLNANDPNICVKIEGLICEKHPLKLTEAIYLKKHLDIQLSMHAFNFCRMDFHTVKYYINNLASLDADPIFFSKIIVVTGDEIWIQRFHTPNYFKIYAKKF